MDTQFTYLLLLAASLAGPLLLSFDKKVAFISKRKYWWPAIAWPAVLFIAWDLLFTHFEVWGFNEKYYLPALRIAGLPAEEIIFFGVVPYCCLFVYECVRTYFPQWQQHGLANGVMLVLSLALAGLGIAHYQKAYTFCCFAACALLLALLLALRKQFPFFKPLAFLVSYAIVLLPFLLVNGVLTALPVVQYHPAHHLGIYLYSIPIEDVAYGMLLFGFNVCWYERKKWK